jgi:hypothetical protein
MAGSPVGRGAALDQWQRQAVLAAASLLRERFSGTPGDSRARALHDALLEVVEPTRRALRLQREMADEAVGAALTLRSERRARGRRSGTDRRELEIGPPRGIERRKAERRAPDERRTRR